MSDDFQEKTEEPTQKKLQDARKKGQVAKSQDFSSSALLLTAVLTLYTFSEHIWKLLTGVLVGVFTHLNAPWADSHDSIVYWAISGIYTMVLIMAPLLAAVFLVSLAVNFYQVGFEIATEAMKPKWKQVNIFNPENYKKFFNVQALARLGFGLGKLSVVAIVCYLVIFQLTPEITKLIDSTIGTMFAFMLEKAFYIGLVIAAILIFLGAADMAFQKWKFHEDMKMSKQEVKDERKQSEGDPHLKSKVRSMMQSFTQNRMKENVPHADVVIANPVHYAIALKYDSDKMAAPVVVAKGARKMALVIKSIATDNGVPILENPPLAQALYKVVEVGFTIPPSFYNAVAEVLAYVYRLNESLKEGGPRPRPPQIELPE